MHSVAAARIRVRRRWAFVAPNCLTRYCSFHSTFVSNKFLNGNHQVRSGLTHNGLRVNSRYSVPARHHSTILNTIPSVLVPPVVFVGLLLALWTYKCFMTVVFQDKIIYMPYMPPLTRSEKIEDYERQCKPIEWREEKIRSLDGTKISLCVGEQAWCANETSGHGSHRDCEDHVVICYFQGNGASLPPRLPMLSNVLRALATATSNDELRTRYTIVALSYRGFWRSSGRASQSGIELDSKAMLSWVNSTYDADATDAAGTRLVIWGQSVGAGVACAAAASEISTPRGRLPIVGLLLETPFVSIKRMLFALYPQKWLPYQYLHPFLWNHWDNDAALRTIAGSKIPPRIMLLPATRDEVVPHGQVDELEQLCRELRLDYMRKDVIGALHTEATLRSEGVHAVAGFIKHVSRDRPKART